MFQQRIIELRSLHLESHLGARKPAIAEGELDAFAGVAEMKLGAVFSRETGRFERGQYAHFLEDRLVVWQQRFANMKSREMLFFQHQHALARARKVSGSSAPARSATYD